MAVIYATLIVKGKRTYASVPAVLKAQVKEILIDLELEDLVTVSWVSGQRNRVAIISLQPTESVPQTML